MSALDDSIESVCLLDCSRCSAVLLYSGTDVGAAAEFFRSEGWTDDGNRVYCDLCSG